MNIKNSYYKCTDDLQGGSWCVGILETVQEWKERAIEWADSDGLTGVIKELQTITDEQDIMDYISEIWSLSFEKMSTISEKLEHYNTALDSNNKKYLSKIDINNKVIVQNRAKLFLLDLYKKYLDLPPVENATSNYFSFEVLITREKDYTIHFTTATPVKYPNLIDMLVSVNINRPASISALNALIKAKVSSDGDTPELDKKIENGFQQLHQSLILLCNYNFYKDILDQYVIAEKYAMGVK